jgi:hypothetical protein
MGPRMIPCEWIFCHRCSWRAVYVFCRNAQSKSHSDPHDICMLSLFYQFLNCNLFNQHVLFILWRDTTSELWTLVQFPLHCYTVLLLLTLLLSCILLSYYHSICSILCLHQTGEIDNLIVSWEQSSWLCYVQVSHCCWWKGTRRQTVYLAPLSRMSRS